MKQNYELLARKIILKTLEYIDTKDKIIKQNTLKDLEKLADAMGFSIRKSMKHKNLSLRSTLYQFINPDNGFNETINKLWNVFNLN